jgi:hypothetical protein
VATLRNAREHVYREEARLQAISREQAKGGLNAIVADNPAASDQTRALMAMTRWTCEERVKYARDTPDWLATFDLFRREHQRIMAGDAECIETWVQMADGRQQLDQAKTRRKTGRRGLVTVFDEAANV